MKPIDEDECPTFKCRNIKDIEICLRDDQICNFHNDCMDFKDEENCGSCNFDEGDNCQWTVVDRTTTWRLQKPASQSQDGLPKADASKKSEGGYLFGWNPHDNLDTENPILAKIVSPTINAATGEACTFRFSHKGSGNTILKVGIENKRSDPALNLLLDFDSSTDFDWKSYSVSIGSRPKSLAIYVESFSDRRSGSVVDTFLDNFLMVNCDPNDSPHDRNFTCSFEDSDDFGGFCGWTNVLWKDLPSSLQQTNWIRLSNSKIEPGTDHTSLIVPKRKKSGTWMGFETQDHSVGYLRTLARLQENQEYCFSFWVYLMSFSSPSEINLFTTLSRDMKSDSNDVKLIGISSVRQKEWRQKWVKIESNETKRYLLFSAEIVAGSHIGLDDFVLSEGNCSQFELGGSCDFEMSQCSWHAINHRWAREATGRSHTTGDYNGHFMRQKANLEKEAIMSLRLSDAPEIDYIKNRKPMCISVYYQLKAQELHDFEDGTYIGIRALNNGSIVKSVNNTATQIEIENRPSVWSLLALNFVAKPETILEIYGQRQKQDSVILVDDVAIFQRQCQVNGNCDFETNLCGWTNDNVLRTALFVRFQPTNRLKGTRFIPLDHTTHQPTGHYLLLSTTDIDIESQKFISPIIRSSASSICLSFFYFAKTAHIRESAIVLSFKSLSRLGADTIDLYVNSTSFEWTKFKHTFKNVPHYYTLEFKLFNGVQWFSDFGIDDIHISNGICDSGSQVNETPQSERRWDCSMEPGTACNWNFTGWSVGNYTDQNDFYAPARDHTTGLATGSYALAVNNNEDETIKSIITSAIKLPADRDRCLTFWIYEDTEWTFILRINLLQDHTNTYVNSYESQIENRKRWNLLKMSIPIPTSNQSYRIIIKYSWNSAESKVPQGMANLTKFAIDDIKVRPGLCGHQYDYVYTFESLGFEDLVLEDIQPLRSEALKRYSPIFANNDIVPAFDHTLRSENGNYLLFPSSLLFPHNRALYFKNTITVVNLEPDNSGPKCVRFAFQLSSNITFKAFVLAENDYEYDYDHSDESVLWSAKSPTPKNLWTIAEFEKSKMFKHKLVLYLASEANQHTFIAIDDLVIRNHQCQQPISCDFENSNYCSYSWLPFDDDEFNFELITTPANDPNWLGPKYDHTTGNFGSGYLIFTSLRSSRIQDFHHSRMISGRKDVKIGTTYCLTMFTRLSTIDLSLRLSVVRLGKDYSEENDLVELINLFKVEQKDWTALNANLNETVLGTASQIQLMITATLGANSKGAIAIDDISIQDGICQSLNNGGDGLICEDGTHVNSSQICDFINDCPSGLDEASCGNYDFEYSGTCGWKNVKHIKNLNTASFALVGAKDSSKIALAPKMDGSLHADGHYLLFKMTGKSMMKSKAEIAVNYDQSMMKLKLAYETCVMSFDAYIHTTSHSHFEVKLGPNIDSVSTIYLLDIRSTSKKWQKIHVHLGNQWKPFIVDFTVNESPAHVIAIDNVQFDNCSLPKPRAACDDSEFRCQKYGLCISKDSLCDFVNDCGDNSDEENCTAMASRCNFESVLLSCDIKEESKKGPYPKWRKTSPRKSTSSEALTMFEPMIDNSLRSQVGNFFLLAPSYGTQKELFGTFSSTMIVSKPEGRCRMRFFYYIHDFLDDVEKTKLSIRIRFASKTTPEDKALEITVTNEFQQRWNKKVIRLKDTSPLQVIFTGVLGTKKARIAIDDITFDSGCLLSHDLPETTTILAPTDPYETNPPVTDSSITVSEEPTGTTADPTFGTKPNASPGHGTAIAIGITVPVVLALIAVGAIFWHRSRKTDRNDRIGFSLNRLSKKSS